MALKDSDILMKLVEIVPNWGNVKVTKSGYNEQYIETLNNLLKYIKSIEKQ